MSRAWLAATALAGALAAAAGLAPAASTPELANPGAGIAAPVDEAILRIPLTVPAPGGDQRLLLEATLFRPEGPGPFPLAVINHGSPRDPAVRRLWGRTRFYPQTRWFIERGLAVLVPMRRGYGESEGEWAEGIGPCDDADFLRAGAETARDIGAAVRFVASRPEVEARRVLLVGVSAGGFGSLALASQRVDGLAGVVNFSGGRGSQATGWNCSPQRLVEAMAWYGRTAQVPTLWIYAQNDGFFSPPLVREMYGAFGRAGGRAQLLMLPPYGQDGHALFASADSSLLWGPAVERFLVEVGLRTR